MCGNIFNLSKNSNENEIWNPLNSYLNPSVNIPVVAVTIAKLWLDPALAKLEDHNQLYFQSIQSHTCECSFPGCRLRTQHFIYMMEQQKS